jgi:predicted RNA binding protein YcfA (HicA-like mRNA interferase family)
MTKRKDVVRLLERNGFTNKGGANHDKYTHSDGRWTEIPRHSEIAEWTFRKIRKQAGLD